MKGGTENVEETIFLMILLLLILVEFGKEKRSIELLIS